MRKRENNENPRNEAWSKRARTITWKCELPGTIAIASHSMNAERVAATAMMRNVSVGLFARANSSETWQQRLTEASQLQ
jgi:hypothetical protein